MTRLVAVLALLAGGATVLALGAAAWFTAEAPTATGAAALVLTGAGAAPAVTAAGLVLLAAALTLTIAGTGVGRAAAVAAAVTSAGAAAQALRLALDPTAPLEAAAAATTGVAALEGAAVVLTPAWLAIAVLALMTAVSVVAVPASGRWPRGRSRFERGGEVPATDARTRAMDDWDALGRGEDPSHGNGSLDTRRKHD